MPSKIIPEESTKLSELNLLMRRSDKLIKNVHRQLEYEGRIPPERKQVRDRVKVQNEVKRLLTNKNRAVKGWGDDWKLDHKYGLFDKNDDKPIDMKNASDVKEGDKSNEKKDGNSGGQTQGGISQENNNLGDTQSGIPQEPLDSSKAVVVKEKVVPADEKRAVTNCDAVVLVVVIAQFVGLLAAGLEIYTFHLDQTWNKILKGEKPFVDKTGKIFHNKTLNFKGHLYLEKALEHAARDEPEEIVFIIIILALVIASIVQIWTCYIKAVDVEQYSALLIALYALGGALSIYSSSFLVNAVVNIENNYVYAADMLHNFILIDEDEAVSDPTGAMCQKGEYKNGCESYEYAKLQAFYLERIFRKCGSGSRFTIYSNSSTHNQRIQIFQETYSRGDLKEMGFCSRDGFKFGAAACAILTGMLCAIVPVVFCCESNAGMKKHGIDSWIVLEQFRSYVERDSSGGEESTAEAGEAKK